MTDQLLTINDITKILKVSRLTIYRYIKAGKLPAYKMGRDYRINKVEFEKYLKTTKVKGQYGKKR